MDKREENRDEKHEDQQEDEEMQDQDKKVPKQTKDELETISGSIDNLVNKKP